MPKVYLRKKEFSLSHKASSKKSGLHEIIEVEVNGKLVNRVSRPVEVLSEFVKFFYDRHGESGQLYIIRGSKMNFKSLKEKLYYGAE